ncbi:TRAP transporter large permease [Pseudoruegeria sp. HB172150]|uniref:TRAP transporter large permease n=1 Tax=Pseudoruegeria sp. HB172150 TaxID=2721164 RepID=UPI0015524070|nr:TRAP transporter large permease [Pseudoruegeria sp. HB172150]
MLTWFLPLFLVFILVGMPIFFAMLAAPGIMLWVTDSTRDWNLLYRNVYNGIDSFPLMAIPFFMLAGEMMNRGGITHRLVEFSQALMGHFRGGLAQVNILSSILFAGLSGSAVADTSALGSMLIPAMEREGYTRRFAAAVTAASSVIGPIIPPSGIMIIYAYVMGESVAALFLGGIVPGILVGIGLMLCVRVLADRYELPPAKRVVREKIEIGAVEYWLSFALVRLNLAGLVYLLSPVTEETATSTSWMIFFAALVVIHFMVLSLRRLASEDFRRTCKRAVLPLQTPVLILGGILGGVFTPTEAAAVAAGYALIVSLFILRTMKLRDLPNVLTRAALTSSVVLMLVGAAIAFKVVVGLSHLPETMAEWVLGLTSNPLILLFLINVLLFVVGMFLDAGPAIIILGPILAPIFIDLGVHPVHFAIIMSVNLTVGLATPPMGLILFVASSVSGERVETIAKAILPFLLVEILVIFLITYVPAISMTVPTFFGFVK